MLYLQEHRKLSSLTEIDAKVKYTQLARSLKTYGISFFLVKVSFHDPVMPVGLLIASNTGAETCRVPTRPGKPGKITTNPENLEKRGGGGALSQSLEKYFETWKNIYLEVGFCYFIVKNYHQLGLYHCHSVEKSLKNHLRSGPSPTDIFLITRINYRLKAGDSKSITYQLVPFPFLI